MNRFLILPQPFIPSILLLHTYTSPCLVPSSFPQRSIITSVFHELQANDPIPRSLCTLSTGLRSAVPRFYLQPRCVFVFCSWILGGEEMVSLCSINYLGRLRARGALAREADVSG